MKWHSKIGRIYKSVNGSSQAHLYYYVRHEGVHRFIAGRYWFAQEMDFTRNGLEPIVFKTAHEAKAYCERKDRDTLVITGA